MKILYSLKGVPKIMTGSPYSYGYGDPGPHFHMNMGTRGPQSRGSPFSHDTGSENSHVLLALRWYMVFQIIQYLISRDNYTRCHMTLLAKKTKKMLEVYQTLLPARG